MIKRFCEICNKEGESYRFELDNDLQIGDVPVKCGFYFFPKDWNKGSQSGLDLCISCLQAALPQVFNIEGDILDKVKTQI